MRSFVVGTEKTLDSKVLGAYARSMNQNLVLGAWSLLKLIQVRVDFPVQWSSE